jgi:hypothetical protein
MQPTNGISIKKLKKVWFELTKNTKKVEKKIILLLSYAILCKPKSPDAVWPMRPQQRGISI